MNGGEQVFRIIDYYDFHPWHRWTVMYDDGSVRVVEMLCPADGKDGVKVGDTYQSHAYAVRGEDVPLLTPLDERPLRHRHAQDLLAARLRKEGRIV